MEALEGGNCEFTEVNKEVEFLESSSVSSCQDHGCHGGLALIPGVEELWLYLGKLIFKLSLETF